MTLCLTSSEIGLIPTISAKHGPIATKQKQAYLLNSKPQISSSDLTLAVSLTLNIQGQIFNELYVGQNGLIATKKQRHLLNSKPQMWPDLYPCHDLVYEFFKVKCGICYVLYF